eukprot:733166-Alexandrium_andersonii.AAC.2
MKRLQGIKNPHCVKRPATGVADRAVAQAVGNAFSVNVVERVLVRLLRAAGMYTSLKDSYGEASLPA